MRRIKRLYMKSIRKNVAEHSGSVLELHAMFGAVGDGLCVVPFKEFVTHESPASYYRIQ